MSIKTADSHLPVENNIITLNQQAHLLQFQAQAKLNSLLSFQDDDKKKKSKESQTKDTKGIIPMIVLKAMKTFSEFANLKNGGSVLFTSAEQSLILDYYVKMYYLGFDEGRYSVIYGNGEITGGESTSGSGRQRMSGEKRKPE